MKTVESPYDWVTVDFKLKQTRSIEEMTGNLHKATSAAAYSWIVKGLVTTKLANNPKLTLNVGCGWGRELVPFSEGAGIDLCLPYLKTAHNLTPHHFILADACCLPFKDGCFDFACSAEVIEHVLNPQVFLEEMRRVLMEKGRVVIQTPNLSLTRGKAIDKSFLHIQEFNRRLLEVLLNRAGFTILKITGSTIPYIPTGNRFYEVNWNSWFFRLWRFANRVLFFLKWDIIVYASPKA